MAIVRNVKDFGTKFIHFTWSRAMFLTSELAAVKMAIVRNIKDFGTNLSTLSGVEKVS
ncbi:hypothetical protein [Loigolactobacillus zhaoyuanensis]|uniref:hypothetical protein n=1 Tax=Loigolactobacillus zhaoyuanensis TaxID=2486017 RepID=UPI0013DE2D61|nr:hypothetical protein [Loigolactobacillus zhaoyuanensis]